MPQQKSTTSMPRWTSPTASAWVLPCSAEIASAIRSVFWSRSSLKRNMNRARRAAACRPRPGSAALAAATAASSSAAVESGRIADCSPVAGLKIGAVARARRACERRRRSRSKWSASRGSPSDPVRNVYSILDERNIHTAQSSVFRMPPSVSNSSSISRFWMISGGDRAMMSPVVRISRPFSKALRKAVKARLVGCAGDRLQLDRADQAAVADVDDVRQALQRSGARRPSSRRARRRG